MITFKDPVQRLDAAVTIDDVVTGITRKRVASCCTVKAVVSVAAGHGVIAGACENLVVARFAIKLVVARVAVNGVVADACEHGIVASTRNNTVSACCAFGFVDAFVFGVGVVGVDVVVARGAFDNIVANDIVGIGKGRVASRSVGVRVVCVDRIRTAFDQRNLGKGVHTPAGSFDIELDNLEGFAGDVVRNRPYHFGVNIGGYL